MKISVESAGAVASNVFFESLTTRQSGRLTADSHNLMVVLAHLQGVAATFRVGRHHHRGPLCEGRCLTHALTDTAPTDLTVAAALEVGEEGMLQAAAPPPVVETGESQDVGTRARLHCDGTGL